MVATVTCAATHEVRAARLSAPWAPSSLSVSSPHRLFFISALTFEFMASLIFISSYHQVSSVLFVGTCGSRLSCLALVHTSLGHRCTSAPKPPMRSTDHPRYFILNSPHCLLSSTGKCLFSPDTSYPIHSSCGLAFVLRPMRFSTIYPSRSLAPVSPSSRCESHAGNRN